MTLITETEKKTILDLYGLLNEQISRDGFSFVVKNNKLIINGASYTLYLVKGALKASAKISKISQVNDSYVISGSVTLFFKTYSFEETMSPRAENNLLTGLRNSENDIFLDDISKEGNTFGLRLIADNEVAKVTKVDNQPKKPITPVTPTSDNPSITKVEIDTPKIETPIANFDNIIKIAKERGVYFPSEKIYKDTNGVDMITLDVAVDIDEKERFFCKITNSVIYGCKSYNPEYQKIADTIKITT